MTRLLIVLLVVCCGCVCQPGGKIINYWGWRSVQVEHCTNINFQVDGGARAHVSLTPGVP